MPAECEEESLLNVRARPIRIALDAMGGDHAPQEVIKGTVMAARGDIGLEPILVGPPEIIKRELAKYDITGLAIRSVPADDFIKEEESPALAIRRKPNSSISVAYRLVKSGEADALLGATATGTLVAGAIQYLGMIAGIERPVIGAVLSMVAPTTVILDLGVNMDCRPRHLVNFAVIGTVYARKLLDIPDPRVALLNIGRENFKGNQLTRETYHLLEQSGLNFIGNVEGDDILSGKANVVVCDGFVGNTILKFSESLGRIVNNLITSQVKQIKDNQQTEPVMMNLQDQVSRLVLPGAIGGGVLWGVDGLVAKAHGNSLAAGFVKRLAQVKLAAERDVIGSLKQEMAQVKEKLNW
jgi:glycerol-3-phosphate acyltransferase PlsX